MIKVKSPTEKKRLSLLTDRRNVYGECPTSSRRNISRGPLFVPGGSAMGILIPWEPVVLVWGLLSKMILLSFVAFSLLQGKSPFGL
jgi:hypothetical protein